MLHITKYKYQNWSYISNSIDYFKVEWVYKGMINDRWRRLISEKHPTSKIPNKATKVLGFQCFYQSIEI
jgi:hypothetical protein